LQVVRIMVVGVYTPDGFEEVEPTQAFTMLPAAEVTSIVAQP
jgi:hypothetical protein